MFKLKLYKVGPTVELQMPWTFLRFFKLPVQAPKRGQTFLRLLLGVSQYIDISQYKENLYRIAIRNSYRNISRFFFLLIKLLDFSFNSCLLAIASLKGVYLSHLYPHNRYLYSHVCMYIILILLRKVQN